MGLKAWFKQKVRELKCKHDWEPVKNMMCMKRTDQFPVMQYSLTNSYLK